MNTNINIPIYFPEIYDYMGITSYNSRLVVQIFLFVVLINIVLRVLLSILYQKTYSIFLVQAKPINNKEDLKNIKIGLFSKVVNNFIRINEKGYSNVLSKDIVNKELLRGNFFFFSYSSIETAINNFEKNVVLIGFLLSLILGERVSIAIITIAVWAIVSLFKMLFDYSIVREKIIHEMSIYLDSEIGVYYVKDSIGAINQLKSEMKNIMDIQSKSLDLSIKSLGDNLSQGIEKSLNSLTEGVSSSVNKFADIPTLLESPLNNWKDLINETITRQEELNKSLASIGQAVSEITKVHGLTTEHMSTISQATTAIKDNYQIYLNNNEDMNTQLKYIRTNQLALEESLANYEITLKEITGLVGEGLGRIIDFQLQKTYSSIIDGIQQSYNTITTTNTELLGRIQALFEQMQEQSKSETKAIISIKEQMDLNFETMKEK